MSLQGRHGLHSQGASVAQERQLHVFFCFGHVGHIAVALDAAHNAVRRQEQVIVRESGEELSTGYTRASEKYKYSEVDTRLTSVGIVVTLR